MAERKALGRIVQKQNVNEHTIRLEAVDWQAKALIGRRVVLAAGPDSQGRNLRVGSACIVAAVEGREALMPGGPEVAVLDVTLDSRLSAAVPAASSDDWVFLEDAEAARKAEREAEVAAWNERAMREAQAVVVGVDLATGPDMTVLRGCPNHPPNTPTRGFASPEGCVCECGRLFAAYGHTVGAPVSVAQTAPEAKAEPSVLDPMGFPKAWRLAHAKACDCAQCRPAPASAPKCESLRGGDRGERCIFDAGHVGDHLAHSGLAWGTVRKCRTVARSEGSAAIRAPRHAGCWLDRAESRARAAASGSEAHRQAPLLRLWPSFRKRSVVSSPLA
jgi:hypothetical protein